MSDSDRIINHEEEMVALLATIVSGNANDAERREVDIMINSDETIKAELEFLEAIREQYLRSDFLHDRAPAEFGWHRLKRDIYKSQKIQSKSVNDRVIFSGVAAVLVGIVLAAQFAFFYDVPEAEYQLLGKDYAGQQILQVKFNKQARIEQIEKILGKYRLKIVEGPGASGLYRLSPESGELDTEYMDELVRSLQSMDELIDYAGRQD